MFELLGWLSLLKAPGQALQKAASALRMASLPSHNRPGSSCTITWVCRSQCVIITSFGRIEMMELRKQREMVCFANRNKCTTGSVSWIDLAQHLHRLVLLHLKSLQRYFQLYTPERVQPEATSCASGASHGALKPQGKGPASAQLAAVLGSQVCMMQDVCISRDSLSGACGHEQKICHLQISSSSHNESVFAFRTNPLTGATTRKTDATVRFNLSIHIQSRSARQDDASLPMASGAGIDRPSRGLQP